MKSETQVQRMDYAVFEILEAGYDVTLQVESQFQFLFCGNIIKVFPYTGWFTGAGIRDGRGIHNLLKQI